MFSRHSLKSNGDRHQSHRCLKLNWEEWSHCHLSSHSQRVRAGRDTRSPKHFIVISSFRLSASENKDVWRWVLHFSLTLERCRAEELCRLYACLCVIYSRADTRGASQKHIPSAAVYVIRCLNKTKLYTRLDYLLLHFTVYTNTSQIKLHVKNVLILY